MLLLFAWIQPKNRKKTSFSKKVVPLQSKTSNYWSQGRPTFFYKQLIINLLVRWLGLKRK